MKKVIAKEFLWFIITFILAFPLGLLFLWFLGFTTEVVNLDDGEKDYILALYLIGYLISFVAIYMIRFISIAVKALADVGKEVIPEP